MSFHCSVHLIEIRLKVFSAHIGLCCLLSRLYLHMKNVSPAVTAYTLVALFVTGVVAFSRRGEESAAAPAILGRDPLTSARSE